MTLSLSSGMSAAQTALIAQALQGGSIRIFAGARPDLSNDPETGTLLGVVSVNGLEGAGLHFQAQDASIVKAEEVWAFRAQASGTATWFRMVGPGDDGDYSKTAKRIDGDINVSGTPSDMTWNDTNIVEGLFYTLDFFVYLLQPTPNG